MQNNNWTNVDNSVGLKLDLVGFWTMRNGELNVWVSGTNAVFNGPEAEEIYNKLTSQKQII